MKSYAKDSARFVQKIQGIILPLKDILVSFDVVSLFIKVPVTESLGFIP